MDASHAGLGPLRELERLLCLQSDGVEPVENGIVALEAKAKDRRLTRVLRGPFLRYIILQRLPSSPRRITELRLERVCIEGSLDLSGIESAIRLQFHDCVFRKPLHLSDAKLASIWLRSGFVPRIFADRLQTSGSFVTSRQGGVDKRVSTRRHHQPTYIGTSIRMSGAKIGGNLDLRGTVVIGEQDLDGRRVCLRADGTKVDGSVLLSEGFWARGEVRLSGLRVGRNLDFSGARLDAPERFALTLAGSKIEGDAYFRRSLPATMPAGSEVSFCCAGTIRFTGSQINGGLDFTDAECNAGAFGTDLSRSAMPVVDAQGLSVGTDIKFVRSRMQGCVDLINLNCKGDLVVKDAEFDLSGGHAFVVDGGRISGAWFLSHSRTTGVFRFATSELLGGLYVNGLSFDGSRPLVALPDDSIMKNRHGAICGLYGNRAKVSGRFVYQQVRYKGGSVPFWVHLAGSKISHFDDDRESWEAVVDINLTGCDYAGITNVGRGLLWRVRLLDRIYCPLNAWASDRPHGRVVLSARIFLHGLARRRQPVSRPPELLRDGKAASSFDQRLQDSTARFKPQPYLQLAKVLRQSGLDGSANAVLIALERNRTRYGALGPATQFARWVIDLTLLYGFDRLRPVAILLVWSAISSLVFETAYLHHHIVASALNGGTGTRHLVGFNPLLYSLDSLVPIIDLNQKKNWLISPIAHSAEAKTAVGGLLRSLVYAPAEVLALINTVVGWFFTTLFAAGLTGLLHSKTSDV